MRRRYLREKNKKGFRMPYGKIALGGVIAMATSPLSSHAFLCFCAGLLVALASLALAVCRRFDEPSSNLTTPWWYGGL